MYPHNLNPNIKNNNILIVEDDDVNYKLLHEILTLNKYNVIRASNGKESIKIIENEKNKFFLILMDIKMPIMNGFDACYLIKKNNNIPIIAQTAGVLANTLEKFEHYKFDKVIFKPFSLNHLLKVVNYYFTKSQKIEKLEFNLN